MPLHAEPHEGAREHLKLHNFLFKVFRVAFAQKAGGAPQSSDLPPGLSSPPWHCSPPMAASYFALQLMLGMSKAGFNVLDNHATSGSSEVRMDMSQRREKKTCINIKE